MKCDSGYDHTQLTVRYGYESSRLSLKQKKLIITERKPQQLYLVFFRVLYRDPTGIRNLLKFMFNEIY